MGVILHRKMQCNYEIIRWILYITKVHLELFAKERFFFSKKPLQNINIISISTFSIKVLILGKAICTFCSFENEPRRFRNQKKTINVAQVWFFKRHSQRHLNNKEATFSDTKDIISWLHTISEAVSHLISQNASYLMWKTEIRIMPPK